ncbi:hypothetical protein [Demequina zhanjiangensis]|uniref:5' nucleotidase, deoxy (Pyrimidine), type C protein (NT5C) n=1 Tax=Demequina zhanjiangensis TaxID=3051659 RepID=A0ABT8G3J8_9MICO|nr:hypothetical protein [Demequina sp. SYSU T00b26]MDN4473729.1 hypothetical protein [Demequina sp. SYSU T00b26]
MASVALLLDVDGVLCPFAAPDAPRDHWPADTWRVEPIEDLLDVEWSTAVVDRLRDLTGRPDVEGLWCTTWTWRAPRMLGGVLGLGEDWEYLDHSGGRAFAEVGWWKAVRAREALALYDGVVWIDDLLDSWRDELAIEGAPAPEFWPGGRLLTLSPAPDRGIEPHHLDAAEAFIEDVLG